MDGERGTRVPKAALFAFALAVLAYNSLQCVRAAVAGEVGVEKVDRELSMYYVGLEVKEAVDGFLALLDPPFWTRYDAMSLDEIAEECRRIMRGINFDRYKKSPRSPRKPRRKKPKIHTKSHVHRATADVLAARPPVPAIETPKPQPHPPIDATNDL